MDNNNDVENNINNKCNNADNTNQTQSQISGVNFTLNTWHHIVWVIDKNTNTVKFYLDGNNVSLIFLHHQTN